MVVGSGLDTPLRGNSGGLQFVGWEGKGLTRGGGTFSLCFCVGALLEAELEVMYGLAVTAGGIALGAGCDVWG